MRDGQQDWCVGVFGNSERERAQIYHTSKVPVVVVVVEEVERKELVYLCNCNSLLTCN